MEEFEVRTQKNLEILSSLFSSIFNRPCFFLLSLYRRIFERKTFSWLCLNYKGVVEVGVIQVGGARKEHNEGQTCSG